MRNEELEIINSSFLNPQSSIIKTPQSSRLFSAK